MNLEEINNQISSKLSNYIEFDINGIFIDDSIKIFGGAIRDSIANMPINDIDILCGPRSLNGLANILTNNGYVRNEYLVGRDLHLIYKDIRLINDIHTYIKGSKVVQLIRPVMRDRILSSDEYIKLQNDFISNVDISCCGVMFDVSGFNELVKDAFICCVTKMYYICENHTLYDYTRCSSRCYKLDQRGWTVLVSDKDYTDMYDTYKFISI